MASSIWDGLFTARDASEPLDGAREPLSESHSPSNDNIHDWEVLESPDPPSEEQEAGEELKWELIRELDASNPSDQFDAQVQTEYEGMCQGVRDRTRRVTPGASLLKAAETNVRQRWVEQGIWRDEWSGDRPWPRQKHEEAIEEERR